MGNMIGDIASAVGNITTAGVLLGNETNKWNYKLVGVKKDMLLDENGKEYANKISHSIRHSLHSIDYLLLRQKNIYDDFMIVAYGTISPFRLRRAPKSDLRLTKKDIKYYEFKLARVRPNLRLKIISKLGIAPDKFYKAEGEDFNQAEGDTQVKVTQLRNA